MLRYKGIIVQVRVARAHAVDLFHLTGRKILARIETPSTLQKSLPAQNLVQAGNATGKAVSRVE